jgi:hypothetical protein
MREEDFKEYRENRQNSKQKITEYIETRAGRYLPLVRGKHHRARRFGRGIPPNLRMSPLAV